MSDKPKLICQGLCRDDGQCWGEVRIYNVRSPFWYVDVMYCDTARDEDIRRGFTVTEETRNEH